MCIFECCRHHSSDAQMENDIVSHYVSLYKKAEIVGIEIECAKEKKN